MYLRLVVFAGATALAACQPLPQPFAEDRPPPGASVLTLRDGAGVVVGQVAGTDEATGDALAEAMAEALRDAGTPASTGGGNLASFHLAGEARGREIRWRLSGPDGAPVGDYAQKLDGGLAASGAKVVAARAAPRIVAFIQEDTPSAVDGGGPSVVIRGVEGAPGDGGPALSRAMTASLRQANVALAPEGAAGAYILAGRVAMTKPAQRKQHVKIVWELHRPDGERIGEISQENDVPAGSLDGPWGDVAYAVTNAATPGIVALLEKVKEAEAGAAKS